MEDCLDSAEIIAVKKVEGYVLGYSYEKSTQETPKAITPYIFDLNYGWVGKGDGKWTPESPTKCYLDIYEVNGGTKYYLTLGETAGTRFRIIFTTVDVSQATTAVTGVAVNKSNYDNPAPYQNLYYTPSNDGYLVIQKDNAGTSGIETYLYEVVETSTTVTEFDVVSVGFLSLIPPIKTSYGVGEKFDYTGAKVTAFYEDGRVADVTADATFSPANGTTVTSSDPTTSITLPVSISYEGSATSFDVTVYGIALLSLEITSPTKTRYSKGEALDYTGFTATAVYGDGTTKDVTELVAFSTENGSIINEDTTITVSYTEGVDTVTNNFSAIVPVLQSLQVTPPTKTEYYEFGEILDYTGLKVIAKYKNIDSVDVTSAVIITPSDGSVITEDMNDESYVGDLDWYLKIIISYTDSWGNNKSVTIHDLTIPKSHLLLEYPTKRNYHVGDVLDYTGLKVEWQAKNGQKIDVTSSVDLSISEGTTIPSSWSESYYVQHYGYTPKTIYISYTNPSGDSEKRYFNIKVYP